MSLIVMLFLMAIGVSIEEAIERHQQRVYFARRRARRYTFN